MRVLNVEDNALKHEKIARVLGGCHVSETVWVRTFKEAKQMLLQPYDLVITDMSFPMAPGEPETEDAGERMMEALKAQGNEIPVILCSSLNYKHPEAFGCVWYSERRDWETELAMLVRRIFS